MGIGKSLLAGVAAGAAGTTALNAITYLDMAIRGRPASSAPDNAVQTISSKLGLHVPGDQEVRQNRTTGLGALLGIATGVGVGVVFGAARAAGLRPSLGNGAALIGLSAMLGSDIPMVLLGISDARKWSAADWASDLAPHLGYGLATAAVLDALDRPSRVPRVSRLIPHA